MHRYRIITESIQHQDIIRLLFSLFHLLFKLQSAVSDNNIRRCGRIIKIAEILPSRSSNLRINLIKTENITMLSVYGQCSRSQTDYAHSDRPAAGVRSNMITQCSKPQSYSALGPVIRCGQIPQRFIPVLDSVDYPAVYKRQTDPLISFSPGNPKGAVKISRNFK